MKTKTKGHVTVAGSHCVRSKPIAVSVTITVRVSVGEQIRVCDYGVRVAVGLGVYPFFLREQEGDLQAPLSTSCVRMSQGPACPK